MRVQWVKGAYSSSRGALRRKPVAPGDKGKRKQQKITENEKNLSAAGSPFYNEFFHLFKHVGINQCRKCSWGSRRNADTSSLSSLLVWTQRRRTLTNCLHGLTDPAHLLFLTPHLFPIKHQWIFFYFLVQECEKECGFNYFFFFFHSTEDYFPFLFCGGTRVDFLIIFLF